MGEADLTIYLLKLAFQVIEVHTSPYLGHSWPLAKWKKETARRPNDFRRPVGPVSPPAKQLN